MEFIVIVVFYNMEQWLGRSIESLRTQSYRNFRCLLGDDMSTDSGAEIAARSIRDDPRFKLIRHGEKKFNLGNTAALIELAQPKDDDVIVLVDGDDYLAHPHVLQKLADVYKEYGCWMTYGSFRGVKSMERAAICRPYPPQVLLSGKSRKAKWRVAHLRTFKYKLWKAIRPDALTITKDEFERARRRALWTGQIRTWLQWRKIRYTDLIDPSGRYVRRCADKAFTFPMLELAGPRVHFIDEILYVFNTYEKDLNFGVRRNRQKWYTRCIRDIIKHKPCYQRLTG